MSLDTVSNTCEIQQVFFFFSAKQKTALEVPNDINKGSNYDHCMASPRC